MSTLNDLKVGFIGCGKIAHFHADTLKHFNVQINCLSYKSNKDNAELFAKKYDVKKIYTDWRLMIKESEVDFLWVVPSWDQIDLIFSEIIESRIPAFFEKPISYNPKKINNVFQIATEDQLSLYQIGYNRRYYDVVNKLQGLLANEKIVSVFLDIPEPVKNLDGDLLKNRLIQNSSHIFDLLFFILDDFQPKTGNLIPIYPNQSRSDFIGIFKVASVPVCVNSIWNSPQNYCMKFYTESEKVYQLSPFEELTVIDGFNIMEPDASRPIRQYKPRISSINFEPVIEGFKPGFKQQTEDFLNNTLNKRRSFKAPSIKQSYNLIHFLSELNNSLH